jgi:hypothetical protein
MLVFVCVLLFCGVAVGIGTFDGTTAGTFGDIYVGYTSQNILIKVVNPPDGSLVRLTPIDDSDAPQKLTFFPSGGIQFSPSRKEQYITIKADTDSLAKIQWQISNSVDYTAPADTFFTPSQRPVKLSDGPVLTAYVGLTRPPLLVYTEYPLLASDAQPTIEIEPTGADVDNFSFLPSQTLTYDINTRSGFFSY